MILKYCDIDLNLRDNWGRSVIDLASSANKQLLLKHGEYIGENFFKRNTNFFVMMITVACHLAWWMVTPVQNFFLYTHYSSSGGSGYHSDD